MELVAGAEVDDVEAIVLFRIGIIHPVFTEMLPFHSQPEAFQEGWTPGQFGIADKMRSCRHLVAAVVLVVLVLYNKYVIGVGAADTQGPLVGEPRSQPIFHSLVPGLTGVLVDEGAVILTNGNNLVGPVHPVEAPVSI